jgi:proteasome assembly chaperone (PAC2) family protein
LTGSVVREGILNAPQFPYGKFYYWKNKAGENDLIIFISNAQPDLAKADSYCKRIISLAKNFNAKLAIGFAAMPQPIDHLQVSSVWFSATSLELINHLKKYNLRLLSEGQISGMNGLFLGMSKKQGLDGFCLLGETPLYTIQIENPKASLAVLEQLGKILDIQIDTSGLIAQAQHIEEEINKLLDYLKIAPFEPDNPIGEEEIEKIKKTLGQLTKLPASVKERIDRLFEEAKTDISKAHTLKSELDKWNVYKEYEDKFLDLFKRVKPKDN